MTRAISESIISTRIMTPAQTVSGTIGIDYLQTRATIDVAHVGLNLFRMTGLLNTRLLEFL